jgi:hypothetical protein
MRRFFLAVLVTALLVSLPAAAGASGERLRGTVSAKSPSAHTVAVSSRGGVRHLLGVPGSQARIHVGQSVELRGRTLREHRHGSRVLARGVIVLRTERAIGRAEDEDDDELEVEGVLTSLTPLTAAGKTCSVTAGFSLAGFEVGDVVELTCDRIAGVFTVRRLEHEDEDENENQPVAVAGTIKIQGAIGSLSPLTVATVTCDVPAGFSMAGFAVGDVVELTCDLVGGRLVARKLQSAEDEDREEADDGHDHSGPGHGDDDDDDDHSGSGRGGDD